VKLRVAETLGELLAIRSDWDDLASRADAPSPFSRPEWVVPWLRTFGSDLHLQVVLAFQGHELVGLLPFRRSTASRLKLSGSGTLTLLHNDHTPETDLLIDPSAQMEVIEHFLSWASGPQARVSTVTLDRFTTGASRYGALSSIFARRRALVFETATREAGRTQVNGDFTTFLGRRSKNFRKQAKKAERSAAANRLSVELIQTASELDAAYPELVAVSNASWQGQRCSGAFCDPIAAPFYREVSRAFAERGCLRLFVCRRDGVPIGYLLHLVEGPILHALKSEFHEELTDCMVGWQLGRAAYELAHRERLVDINMGAFPTDFKRRWTTHVTPQTTIRVFSPSLLGSADYVFPHLSKEIIKRVLGRPSVARCLPFWGA
jgi:hypothetical protein